MNDLISRYSVKTLIQKSDYDLKYRCNREEMQHDVDELPTTDAIRVEWLEWRAMNAKYNGIKEAADAFEFVLKCWKEREAQDG